jgi:hypothetical protein
MSSNGGMAMNIGSYFAALGVACASTACALDATPGGNDPDPESAIAPEPAAALAAPSGGNPCAAILRLGRDGNLKVDGYLCPMPSKPIPDPALGAAIPSEPDAIAEGEETPSFDPK